MVKILLLPFFLIVSEEMEQEVGVSRCKLLCIEWINKVLLYSTKNYIQYAMINHNSKGYCKNVYTHTHTHTHIYWVGQKIHLGFSRRFYRMNEHFGQPCIYIYLNHFAIQQKLAWHCKSTTILKNNPTVYLKQVCLLYISYTSVTPFGKKIQHLYVEVCCHFLLL